MAERVGELPVHATVAHGGQQEAATELVHAMTRRFDVRELHLAHFTPVMAAHSGPVLGMGFYTDEAGTG